ncbi:MAG TPA: NADH-quinone oxidoreductase subunit NuoH [Balneolales bacterium]|nr:NADH-quinone oxidoreductase subunit NuoH [Balneolales bacterium]
MSPLAFSLIVLVVALFITLNSAAITVYAERRIAAFIQNRVGPNRVGPKGLFQPLADVLKLIMKEDVTPNTGNKFLHTIAPMIPVSTALIVISVIPFGEGIYIANINVSVLFILAISSLSVYGVTLAGWSSNSKYSLLGGLRAAAQMLSYELPMGLAVASCVVYAGSLNMIDIVHSQAVWWNVFKNPVGFVIFAVAAFAETNRTPFDLVEAEQELVGGFHTEYSSMKFGMFFLAEYMHVVIASMLITTFFFGAYTLPFQPYWLPHMGPWVKGIFDIVIFSLKTVFWVFIFIVVRWTIPRFKYNQLMHLGWNKLLPLAVANFMVIATLVYLYNIFIG